MTFHLPQGTASRRETPSHVMERISTSSKRPAEACIVSADATTASSAGGETEKGKKRALRQLQSPSSPPPAKRPVPDEEKGTFNNLEVSAKRRESPGCAPGQRSSGAAGLSAGPLQVATTQAQTRKVAELGQRLSSRLDGIEAEHEQLLKQYKVLARRQGCMADTEDQPAARSVRVESTHAETQTKHDWNPPTAPQSPSSPDDNNSVVINTHEVAIEDALNRSKDALIARQATIIKELEETQQHLEAALEVSNSQIELLSELGTLFLGY